MGPAGVVHTRQSLRRGGSVAAE
ncbi:hypothetical protein YPPY96_4532, partial [Yersinia pestis PY-96]